MEGLFKWFRDEKKKVEDGSPRTVNIYLGFFLMVNLVLGTGFLSIPYGFANGGVLAGVFTLLSMTLLSWLCAIWVLETMARSQAITDLENGNDIQTASRPHFYITIQRKFEPTEMCKIFVGNWLGIVYVIMLIIITFFAAMAYSTVAGSAWAVNIPFHFGQLNQCSNLDFTVDVFPTDSGCAASYRFCLFIFGCIVVFLSLLSLKEQLIVQVILGILRFSTIGAISLYCLVNLFMGNVIEDCDHPLPYYNYSDNSSHVKEADLFNATIALKEVVLHFNTKQWLVSIAIFAYAHILHQAIPALTQPVRKKEWLRGYFNALFLTLGGMYLLMGLTASLWFRDCTNETCTLNWAPLSKPGNNKALRALSYFIVLFPSIDVCSAFPLVVHTTVNNIYTVILRRDTTQDKGIKFIILQTFLKLMAAIIPLGVAMFVANLVTVLNYAGLIGFFICFYFPVLLQLASQWRCLNAFSKLPGSNLTHTQLCSGRDSSAGSSDEEKMPLIKRPKDSQVNFKNKSISFLGRLLFFFSGKGSILYDTPYSLSFLSSPLVALIVGIITSSFLIITIVSLILPS